MLLLPQFKDVHIAFKQFHGFSHASEQANSGVVYFCMVDTTGRVHTSLVMAKTKVAPIKRISIPRLELCGAQLLAHLLHHCQRVLEFPTEDMFAWTDSTIVLNWIVGNLHRFKTYVGNRISCIVDLTPLALRRRITESSRLCLSWLTSVRAANT